MRRWLLSAAVVVLAIPGILRADKVIMKDGKIYEGRIMGESNHSVLISNPLEPKPRFLQNDDILTIIHDQPVLQPMQDTSRYATVETSLSGNVFSARNMSLSPAAGLHLDGGLRIHPLVELDAQVDWIPALSGDLSVTDGTTVRHYSHFYGYSGGFAARLFPFYHHKDWSWEPYVLAGYSWNRLNAKDSGGDYLSGRTLLGGLGVQVPITQRLYWDARFLYQQTSYGQVQFQMREGSLNSTIQTPAYTLLTGLSFRLF